MFVFRRLGELKKGKKKDKEGKKKDKDGKKKKDKKAAALEDSIYGDSIELVCGQEEGRCHIASGPRKGTSL